MKQQFKRGKQLAKSAFLLICLYQFTRFIFYLFNSGSFVETTMADIPSLLLGGLRFDLAAIAYTNTLFWVLMALPFSFVAKSFYQTFCKWLFILTNTLCLSMNLIDVAYFPFLGHRTNAGFFIEFQHEMRLFLGIHHFIFSFWYVPLLIGIVAFILMKSYQKWLQFPLSQEELAVFSFPQLTLFLLILVLWLGGGRGSYMPATRPLAVINAGDYISKPNQINLVLNTPATIIFTYGNIKIPAIHYFSRKESEKYFNPKQAYPKNGAEIRKKNVVIIVVESFSKEFIGGLNPQIADFESYTPFIDSLIPHCFYSTHSFANGQRSIEALPSVVASLPSHNEAYAITPYGANNRINSIASVLKKYNYSTSFFHGAVNGSMGFSAFMNIANFDQYFGMNECNEKERTLWGIDDKHFLSFWAKELSKQPKPFCSLAFTLSSHHPFIIPEEEKGNFKKGPKEIHELIGFVDYSLREFFRQAQKTDWYENTIFVITADHTYAKITRPEYGNTRGAMEVPILFFTPDKSLVGKTTTLHQQCDIFPTLLDYLNVQDSIIAFGKSVLSDTSERYVVNWHTGAYQTFYQNYMLCFDGQKKLTLIDFHKDIFFQNNLLGTLPEVEDKMLNYTKAYMEQYNNRVRENNLTLTTYPRKAFELH